MSGGVKLASLSLQDVGGLDARIDLGPFGDGVSVISGCRAERAALVAALRAALFERHDERHEGIKALQEQGARSGPEIQLELTLDGERVSVHKRFLERPFAEVRLHGEGAVFTGAKAEEVVGARLAGRAESGQCGLLRATRERSAPGDGATMEDPIAAALDLAAQLAELTAQLGAIEGQLPALEQEWSAAVAAESRAHDLERAAQDAEFHLANAEALLDQVHCDLAKRVALASEVEALGREIEGVELASLPETSARRGVILETLAALRSIASDELLKNRHTAALAALRPAHRRARSAAAALEEVTPQVLRGETLRARGAITACTRRANDVRARLSAVKTWIDRAALEPRLEELSEAPLMGDLGWLAADAREELAVVVRLAAARMIAGVEKPLPILLDDTMGWNDDGRFVSMVQMLRDTPSRPQIILLTADPSRFARLQVDYAVDLDQLRSDRRRALGLDRISG